MINHNLKAFSMIALCSSFSMTAAAVPIAVFNGQITDKTPGWTFQESKPNQSGMTYNEFEGYYPDKGGKLFSKKIKLDKPADKPGYYRIKFTAYAKQRAYQGINFYDAQGTLLPDLYDVIYAGPKRDYTRIFYAMGKADSAEIFFQSKDGCMAWDVSLEHCTVEDAAAYCDKVYQDLPEIKFTAPKNSLSLIPKTAEALKTGKPWRIVLLGDSIMQDTFHSQFHSLVKREFPDSNIDWVISMRGGTGCWYYCKDENFKKYVVDEKPDLLMIGGISNYRKGENPTGTEAMELVAKRAKEELGCEVMFLSAALACDTRQQPPESTPDTPIPPSVWKYDNDEHVQNGYDVQGLAAAAKRLNIPLLDMATPCYTWLYSSGLPFEFYSRDKVHSGEKGKQIICRILMEYLKTLK